MCARSWYRSRQISTSSNGLDRRPAPKRLIVSNLRKETLCDISSNSVRFPLIEITVSVFITNIDVGILEAGALLRVLNTLQLRNQRRLPGRIVA